MKRPQKQNEDVEIEDDSDADDSQWSKLTVYVTELFLQAVLINNDGLRSSNQLEQRWTAGWVSDQTNIKTFSSKIIIQSQILLTVNFDMII
jgi:hypothetical protein